MASAKSVNKGIWYALGTACISGVSIFVNKIGVNSIDSSLYAGLKNTGVALMLLALITLVNGKNLRTLRWRNWAQLAFIGLIGGSVPFLLFFHGLTLTSAANASFVHKSMFLFAVPLAAIFLKERVNREFMIAAFFLMAGNIMLLQKNKLVFTTGDFYILVATVMWATENVLAKHLVRSLSGNLVAFGRMFFGALFIWIYLNLKGGADSSVLISSDQWFWVSITTMLLFGYVVSWYNALRWAKVTTALAILLLGGPITTILSLIFLPGPISQGNVISALATVFGLVFLLDIKKIILSLIQKLPLPKYK